jgi:hypothetical protein
MAMKKTGKIGLLFCEVSVEPGSVCVGTAVIMACSKKVRRYFPRKSSRPEPRELPEPEEQREPQYGTSFRRLGKNRKTTAASANSCS